MTTTTVSNSSDLLKALSAAQSGDTIQLAAGTYSNVNLSNVNFAGDVTITSADASHPAVISGLDIGSASGLTLSHLQLTYSDQLGSAVYVGSSSNIVFDSDEVMSSPTNRVGTGIFLHSDDHITITNSNLHDLEDGIAHLNSQYVTITNNQIHDMSNDGVRGGGTSNITISHNTFTDFHPAEYAHNDAIQFWTTNTSASAHDITVTDNTMIRGDTGSPVQGIFMGNENSIAYQNVTISGNALVGEAYQGIQLDMANNFVVKNNLVAGYTDMNSWIEVQESSNGAITGNASTSWILTADTNISQSANQFIAQSAVGDMSDYNAWVQTGAVPASAVTGSPDTTGADTSTPPASGAPAAAVTVTGATDGADTLTGPDGQSNVIHGLGGNDSLVGGSGVNQVNGNQGDDTVVGHSTAGDWLLGGQGQDSIDASASTANNILNGNLGGDTLIGGAGADTLRGGQGDDVIHAGPGNVWISGDLGANTLYGGQGMDTFHAGAGHDVVNGWHNGDHVQVDQGVTYQVAQVSGDVHVTFANGGEVDLIGVQQNSLQSGWIG